MDCGLKLHSTQAAFIKHTRVTISKPRTTGKTRHLEQSRLESRAGERLRLGSRVGWGAEQAGEESRLERGSGWGAE